MSKEYIDKLNALKRLKEKGISFELVCINHDLYIKPKSNPQRRTFSDSGEIFNDLSIALELT